MGSDRSGYGGGSNGRDARKLNERPTIVVTRYGDLDDVMKQLMDGNSKISDIAVKLIHRIADVGAQLCLGKKK